MTPSRASPARAVPGRPWLWPLTRIKTWLYQWQTPPAGAVTLSHRRVYIVPSRHGMMFAGSLALMLTGAINYSLSLGFVLVFLLTGLGINSILYTYRNLARLRITGGRAAPVFAGDDARFTLALENDTDVERRAVAVAYDPAKPTFVDVPARGTAVAQVAVAAEQRGVLRPGRFRLYTRYPLGLCYAWAYADLDMHCVVYPRPESGAPPLPPPAATDRPGAAGGAGNEDFAGLRAYHPGDSPRHIAWKAAARGGVLSIKQFTGGSSSELSLDWRDTPETYDTERRLSRMARWVLDAYAANLSFSLTLPGLAVPTGSGEAQRERCLAALATFDDDTPSHASRYAS